ncbi:Hypothetical_protein [Hexamita inflata]|uniref:Hypothetical_protein n=1 Tax=Hexamita inflata TaxID=28002 RepID=A0AA86PYI1_9EUKA|nr:Hypothetical protein HINF_LOCUS3112 [Hexamita inflata]CAI9938657.1 Hypothetical protein HINF_LOCUS26302 [Hexamita inflata]CAI9943307.1 Hypothetical protein HINF_LOCUS30952 [Hexamita inflata]
MNLCTLRQKRMFGGVFVTTAFYQVQNNCIVLHYFDKNRKVEFYYALDQLEVVEKENIDVLVDLKNGIEIERNRSTEVQSLEQEYSQQDDIYFDFEPSVYKMYFEESPSFEKESYKSPGTLRYLSE